jgi:mitochondrial import inner membrane translocase subunit TIM17
MAVSLLNPQPQNPMEDVYNFAKDSTACTAAQGVVGGYVLGLGFSLLGSMISAELSTQSMGTRDFFRYSLRSAHRMGGQFAFFGFIFGGMDVAFEKRRGKKDIWNPTLAGAIIGGGYGWRMYKRPGLIGGFVGGGIASAIFEKIIDQIMPA